MLADSMQMPFKVPPIIVVSESAAEKLFAASDISYREARQKAEQGEVVSRELNQQAAASIQIKHEEVTSSNVIARLEALMTETDRDAINAVAEELEQATRPFAERRMDRGIHAALRGVSVDRLESAGSGKA